MLHEAAAMRLWVFHPGTGPGATGLAATPATDPSVAVLGVFATDAGIAHRGPWFLLRPTTPQRQPAQRPRITCKAACTNRAGTITVPAALAGKCACWTARNW